MPSDVPRPAPPGDVPRPAPPANAPGPAPPGDVLYVGAVPGGWAWSPPQAHLLVLGPPRSGKTSAVVIPNVLVAAGPVVSTSTKPDVLAATLAARGALGRCWLFDPSGEVDRPPGVTPLRWSPVPASANWETARLMARRLVATSSSARGLVEPDHWRGRAEALLAPLLHAAACSGASAGDVARWVDRRETAEAEQALARTGTSARAADVLAGVTGSEDRERSAIFSTAAQALAAYQSDTALEAAREPNFDPAAFARSSDTVYVCASSRAQQLAGPLVVGLVEEICAAAYDESRSGTGNRRPVVLALDETANIAPLPSLPGIVSEGGGQGVLVLACFQDLSQARARWGPDTAEGFLSHFRAKLVLPGLGEPRTLEALSVLAGDVDVPVRSVSRAGGWWQRGGSRTSTTWSTRRQRLLPVAALARASEDRAVYLEAGRQPAAVRLTPWYDTPSLPDIPVRDRPSSTRTRELPAGLGAGERRLTGRHRPGPDLGR